MKKKSKTYWENFGVAFLGVPSSKMFKCPVVGILRPKKLEYQNCTSLKKKQRIIDYQFLLPTILTTNNDYQYWQPILTSNIYYQWHVGIVEYLQSNNYDGFNMVIFTIEKYQSKYQPGPKDASVPKNTLSEWYLLLLSSYEWLRLAGGALSVNSSGRWRRCGGGAVPRGGAALGTLEDSRGL